MESIEKQQQQFNELGPERRHPDPNIPITFTKVIRKLLRTEIQ